MVADAIPSNFSVDARTLTPLVQTLLADDKAELRDWSCKRLPCFGVNPVTAGIYRFSGKAQSGRGLKSWSFILKIIHWFDLGGSGNGYLDSPQDWNYWKREGEAHRCGILANWRGGLVPIRCLAVAEPGSSAVWMWLEDLGEQDHDVWPIERHILSAHHFGEFNGAHVGLTVSAETSAWLCHHYLRKWIATLQTWGLNQTLADPNFWATRHARLALAPGTDVRIRRLMENANALCNLLERQPQTLSHQDGQRANLFATGSPLTSLTTTAIDWSFLGFAAVGEDLGTQIGGNLFKLFVEPADVKHYLHSATEAYIAGLTQSGWRGNPDSVRFACATAASLRYVPFGVMWLQGCMQAQARGEISGLDNVAAERGLSTEEALKRWGAAMSTLLDLADEATRLAGRL